MISAAVEGLCCYRIKLNSNPLSAHFFDLVDVAVKTDRVFWQEKEKEDTLPYIIVKNNPNSL
ncbi:hypothetical protein [Bradyrhizobium sp. SZCCHNR2012]|uniref:hypothetical protein n=1 Tax=Bradyrhizobium sp. SZCCHNR2012 TaxID=3057377 RepID=UPI0028E74905|nr:hypothetical protein [Bradyrhizobium sp. SZCCHNR2012]